MNKHWIYGYEIYRKHDVAELELWESVMAGRLTPHTSTGEKIDVDEWKNRWTVYIEKAEQGLTEITPNAKQQDITLNSRDPHLDVLLEILDINPKVIKFICKYNKMNFILAPRKFRYKIDEVETLFGSQKHLPEGDNEDRNKNKDRKQCRDRAKEYVTNSKTKKEDVSIATAVNIIHSLDFGMTYTERQIRNWITSKPPIFPEESSKRGRRKNS